MKTLKSLLFKINGQAMTEYVLIVIFTILITIPAIKIIPKAFEIAFNKILTFHTFHMN